MNLKGFDQYKEQAINTMTPGELLNVLYSEVVKRLTQAQLALDQKDYTVYDDALDRSVRIIEYLDETLDRKYEISKDLSKLYEYFTYELRRSKWGRHKEVVAHVCSMVKELREAFQQASANVTGNSAARKQA